MTWNNGLKASRAVVLERTKHTSIIVPLDGGQVAERAIPVARALATGAALPVHFVTVLSDSDLDDNATVYLDNRAEEVSGVEVRGDVLHGMPAVDTMIEYLRHHPGSLLCCSTHARSGAKTFGLGSMAEELVRRSPVPVILVGPLVDLPGPNDHYEQVVVGVEGESAYRLVPHVRALAIALQLRASLLQVIGPSYGSVDPENAPQRALLERLGHELAQDDVEPEWHLVEDRNVPLAITTLARQQSRPLLALSSRRRYPEEHYEEASVTVAIARIATCPVLVVGPAVAVEQSGADQG